MGPTGAADRKRTRLRAVFGPARRGGTCHPPHAHPRHRGIWSSRAGDRPLVAGCFGCRPRACSVRSGSKPDDIRHRVDFRCHAGIGPAKAHGRYAESVIELGQVTGTGPVVVAAASGAAAAMGLGRSKGRLHRGYDADVMIVAGNWRPTSLPCRMWGK
jgi:hypothetical protein